MPVRPGFHFGIFAGRTSVRRPKAASDRSLTYKNRQNRANTPAKGSHHDHLCAPPPNAARPVSGWLGIPNTSFSFASYYDRNHMHWGPLRVINDDVIALALAVYYPPAPRYKILTYAGCRARCSTAIRLGTGSVIRPGEVVIERRSRHRPQRPNHSDSEPVHLLRIRIVPKPTGVRPGYHQQTEIRRRGKR